MRKSCKVLVFLGKTPNPEFKRHQQQSMILCPMWNADGTECYPGITPTRSMGVFGHAEDHAELIFDNVRVPAGNMILGEGRGFEIAQGRLGPGRIHHCMRSIGQAEMALSAIIFRLSLLERLVCIAATCEPLQHLCDQAISTYNYQAAQTVELFPSEALDVVARMAKVRRRQPVDHDAGGSEDLRDGLVDQRLGRAITCRWVHQREQPAACR